MNPSNDLLLGRRSLESLQGYELIEDLKWSSKHQKWVLHIQLTLPLSSEYGSLGLVHEQTRWHILIDEIYPLGDISIFPSEEGGIADTFQHQNYNQSSEDKIWRTGNLCVSTSLRSFSRRGYDTEPYSASTRLIWNIERCKVWLTLADKNHLSLNEEPFELPHYPTSRNQVIAFNENTDTYAQWQLITANAGLVDLKQLGESSQLFFVSAFRSFVKGKSLSTQWGYHLMDGSFKESSAIWVRLKSVPLLPPWKAPMTWEELYKAAAGQGIDMKTLLKDTYQRAWKANPRFLLIGFPISDKVGAAPQQFHWLAIQLDKLPPFKGFRKSSNDLPSLGANQLFHPKKQLSWLSTENWDRKEISARGKLSPTIVDKAILIIGAGAVGSALAEMLSRAGCFRIAIMDNDITEIGNMSRHTLTIDNLRVSKAESLANRLNKIFPHNKVDSFKKNLRQELRNNKDVLSQYSIIIDATSSDDVLCEIALANHLSSSRFFSVSLGMYARRLFLFSAPMSASIAAAFRQYIKPWLLHEREEYLGKELPRDGVGCWHPLFPARVDDIWMLTAVAMKSIEEHLVNDTKDSLLIIFEQRYEKGKFLGVSIAEPLK